MKDTRLDDFYIFEQNAEPMLSTHSSEDYASEQLNFTFSGGALKSLFDDSQSSAEEAAKSQPVKEAPKEAVPLRLSRSACKSGNHRASRVIRVTDSEVREIISSNLHKIKNLSDLSEPYSFSQPLP